MRLIGSLTEDDIREQLLCSNAALRAEVNLSALSTFLRDQGVDLAKAYVLDHIPEQSEDIYTVLDGDRRVLRIELARGIDGVPPVVEMVTFADFRATISKESRLRRILFSVAVDLLSKTSEADA